MMDPMDLERESGITIVSNTASVRCRRGQAQHRRYPGHADFGGEVERVHGWSTAACCSSMRPKARCRRRRRARRRRRSACSRRRGQQDRPDERAARQGRGNLRPLRRARQGAVAARLSGPLHQRAPRNRKSLTHPGVTLEPLFDAIVANDPPLADPNGMFQMLVTPSITTMPRPVGSGESRGTVHQGRRVIVDIDSRGQGRPECMSSGSGAVEVESANAGEIVLSGLAAVTIGETISSEEKPEACHGDIGEPTLQMQFGVNHSPFAGREATVSSTSRKLRARLKRAADQCRVAGSRTSIRRPVRCNRPRRAASCDPHRNDAARGLRIRGGGWLAVITKDVDGERVEPVEDCIIDCSADVVGSITEALGTRGAKMMSMRTYAGGGVRLTDHAPNSCAHRIAQPDPHAHARHRCDGHTAAWLGADMGAAHHDADGSADRKPARRPAVARPWAGDPAGARPAADLAGHAGAPGHDRRAQPGGRATSTST